MSNLPEKRIFIKNFFEKYFSQIWNFRKNFPFKVFIQETICKEKW